MLRPAPLQPDDVADLLLAALGQVPDPDFRDAALDATGGNPLLVTVLAREAGELGLAGSAADRERVAQLGADGVAPAVQRRLRTLGPQAEALAQAAAVVGERGLIEDVAALAGVDADTARATLDTLVRAGVLAGDGRSFVHPLVKAAVVAATAPVDRMRLHRLAAHAPARARRAPGRDRAALARGRADR